MRSSHLSRTVQAVLAATAVLGITCASQAIIQHPGDTPPADWARPSDLVVGKWGSNASFVVIAPNFIITTTHQMTSPSTVQIDGQTYYLEYNAAWTGSPSEMDLRMARLTLDAEHLFDARLSDYVEIYTSNREAGMAAVLGGYGRVRGTSLVGGDGKVYGYTWGTGSSVPVWGANVIDRVGGVFNTDPGYIAFDFDGPGVGGYVPYEAAVAEFDSGGGVFTNDQGVWKLIGLIHGVETHGTAAQQTWFRQPTAPFKDDPDQMDAVRVGRYKDWIQSNLFFLGDMNDDGSLDNLDIYPFAVALTDPSAYALAYPGVVNCSQRGDINRDGSFDNLDISALASLLTSTPPQSVTTLDELQTLVPEPATAGLMLLAAGGLVLRRRRVKA